MNYLLRKLPAVLSFGLLFVSCDASKQDPIPTPTPAPTEEGIAYIIKQGVHETNNPLKGVATNKLTFEVRFDSTAIYQTVNPSNQADINKLYGMSDCQSLHHTNSARFGWRWYQNRLELHAYSYANGKNTSTFITAIDLKKKYTCELTLTDGEYTFRVHDKVIKHTRGCHAPGKGYQLYPYFGGDETAPHQIKILINEL